MFDYRRVCQFLRTRFYLFYLILSQPSSSYSWIPFATPCAIPIGQDHWEFLAVLGHWAAEMVNHGQPVGPSAINHPIQTRGSSISLYWNWEWVRELGFPHYIFNTHSQSPRVISHLQFQSISSRKPLSHMISYREFIWYDTGSPEKSMILLVQVLSNSLNLYRYPIWILLQ